MGAVFWVPFRTGDIDHAIRGSVGNCKRPGGPVVE